MVGEGKLKVELLFLVDSSSARDWVSWSSAIVFSISSEYRRGEYG
jgi:hypothetical protein